MKKLKADLIYTLSGEPVKNGTIILDDEGIIMDVQSENEAQNTPRHAALKTEYYQGVIAPGFINAHCHLELSHLNGKIARGKGLIDFIVAVLAIRDAPVETVEVAIREAISGMHDSGVVAIGDISNLNASFGLKAASSMVCHTFIEGFSFVPDRSKPVLQGIRDLKRQYILEFPSKTKPPHVSITPHAPYSVSKELFEAISAQETGILSIHNQESAGENEFYQNGTGAFRELYSRLGIPIDFYHPYSARSLPTYLPWLGNQKKILVHNTFTTKADLASIKHPENVAFCICANANLYITGVLPDLKMMIEARFPMMIGTDSLASNDSLSMVAEMFTIQTHFPELSLGTLLKWASYNPARFFGWDQQFGSIEKGKRPGLVLIEGLDANQRITKDTRSSRIS